VKTEIDKILKNASDEIVKVVQASILKTIGGAPASSEEKPKRKYTKRAAPAPAPTEGAPSAPKRRGRPPKAKPVVEPTPETSPADEVPAA